MKLLLAFGFLAFTSLASANSVMICGTEPNYEKFEVKDFQLMISSENDQYTGAVGENWNLKLGSEESEWEEPNKNITATMTKAGDVTIVDIQMIIGKSSTGPVGERFVISDIYGYFGDPILEKYNIGGVTGPIKTGTYTCIHAFD